MADNFLNVGHHGFVTTSLASHGPVTVDVLIVKLLEVLPKVVVLKFNTNIVNDNNHLLVGASSEPLREISDLLGRLRQNLCLRVVDVESGSLTFTQFDQCFDHANRTVLA